MYDHSSAQSGAADKDVNGWKPREDTPKGATSVPASFPFWLPVFADQREIPTIVTVSLFSDRDSHVCKLQRLLNSRPTS